MKKMKHAIIFMGIGAIGTMAIMKMMNENGNCDVNDLMNKEKKKFKNLKKKMFG